MGNVQRLLIPGAVLQSVMIGGGYGTGREVVEFFTRFGALPGLAGLVLAAAGVALVFALSLELARRAQAFDYRSFFKALLGPFWVSYELLLLLLVMLVLGVISAASHGMLQRFWPTVPSWASSLLFIAVVVGLTFFGRAVVTWLLTFWSLVLYAAFATLTAVVLYAHGTELALALAGGAPSASSDGWALSALRYVGYNVTAIPVVLFAARQLSSRRETLVAGFFGGLLAVLPAVALHLCFVALGAEVYENQALPLFRVLDGLGLPWLTLWLSVVLLGTFLETALGDIQGILERMDRWREEQTGRGFSHWTHGAIALSLLGVAAYLGQLGVVALIGEGYGTLSWGFLLVYILPLLLWGLRTAIAGKAPGGQ
jgi:uncharacterized membrane protein YkvI